MSHVDLTVSLPPGVAREIARLAREAGVTTEQFLASAAAEKLDAVKSASAFLAERGKNADWSAFARVFGSGLAGGEPPRAGDEVT